jgi:hypothetical protein
MQFGEMGNPSGKTLIRKCVMQHEQWLFGGEKYTAPVLQANDEFIALAADG